MQIVTVGPFSYAVETREAAALLLEAAQAWAERDLEEVARLRTLAVRAEEGRDRRREAAEQVAWAAAA